MGTKYKGTKKEKNALDLFIKLVRASDSVSMKINSHIQSEKLTVSQFGVLESLFHLGPMIQNDIGKKLLKTGGNMTMVIDNLEKRKLVKRVRGVEDRRFIEVHLTKKGEDLISDLFPKHVTNIVNVMSCLTQEEQAQLSQLCKKLGKGINP